MEVVLDSSFLLEWVSRPIKRIEELELKLGKVEFVVLDATIKELEKLASATGVKAKKASAALEYVKNLKRVNVVNINSDTDLTISRYAAKHRSAVATLDQELRRRLKETGVTVLTLRDDNLWIDR
ncbi:MAG: PIN domain-containing protein [Nitrososphaerales archaeon]